MSNTPATKREKVTEGLLRSADFLTAVLQRVTQPLAVADREGRFVLWNRAYEEMTGYSPAELLQKEPAQMALPHDRPEERLRLERVMESGQPEKFFAQRLASGGREVPVELQYLPLRSPDREPLLLILAQNLSERRELEEELRQAHKLEGIGKLAGGIAHDFNNVLTTIIGLTESMISGRMLPSAENLREIHHSALHAADLTHSLLAFSRRQILQMRNIRLEEVVARMGKMIARLIGEDIRLDISAAAELPPVRADQSQIEQILLNLCLNARDAMPHGGDLQIQVRAETLDPARRVKLEASQPGLYVLLSVRDTGVGMEEETLRHAFEPFFTRRATGKGTGLGLAMVYGIVKQHDGFIHASSAVGQGSEFTVYFPASSGPVETLRQPESDVTEAGSGTILVVEDEKSVRRLVLEVLTKLGYRVFSAADGLEAVRVFERWADQIDLVLLDAVIPGKDSREVYEAIRQLKPPVRFVFTSGYNEVFINAKFEFEPDFLFLRKPFTTSQLSVTIQQAFAEKR